MALPHHLFVLLGSLASAALIDLDPHAWTKPVEPVQIAAARADMGPAGPVRAVRAADGLFYVTAQIGGRSMRFLVDTGASTTVISPAEARALNLPLRKGAGPALRTVGGTVTGRWAEVPRMTIGGHELSGVDVAVVPHGAPAPLLGQNVLARLGPIVLDPRSE